MNLRFSAILRNLAKSSVLLLLDYGMIPAVSGQTAVPPPVSIVASSGQVADGDVFITPSSFGSSSNSPGYGIGPEILDNQGRPVWFLPLAPGGLATDFRVQTYQGTPVLTWTQGTGFQNTQPGATTDYICDTSYRVIATVQAGNGYDADQHEFQITPQNTALITIYNNVPADLTSVGGPADGMVQEGVAQEIDIATGTVLFEWHSLDYVPLTDSYYPVPSDPNTPYDYFHINSVKLDTDGNLLISSRHTWCVYKVDRTTGAVIWRLGGKSSDFTLGPGLPFAWQHDAEAVDSSTIRIFDNESDGTPVLPASRVIWVHHDDTAMTATLVQSYQHNPGLSVMAEGNGQPLANGDTFVNWGIVGQYSEFDPNGNLIYDVTMAQGYSSYRGYRFPWTASPVAGPTASAEYNVDGTTTVDAVWNGATQVAAWEVLGGASPGALTPVASVAWNGLDTQVNVPGQYDYIQVVALDSSGAVLASSTTQAAGPVFTTQPASQTIAAGGSVIFEVATAGATTTYQWFFNGSPLSDGSWNGASCVGSAGPLLEVSGASADAAGNYTCVATNAGGSATSSAATLTVTATQDPGRLVNGSALAQAGTGSAALDLGFEVGGQQASGSQELLVAAAGPALSSLGVSGALANPKLTVSEVSPLATTFQRPSGSGATALISTTANDLGAFGVNASNVNQSMEQSFEMGSYSASVSGAGGGTGMALAEVFDATPTGSYSPSIPHLLNFSARADIGTGANDLVAGFVIGGSTSEAVVLRGVGPGLKAFGVKGTLAQPRITLFDSNGNLLAENSGWGGSAVLTAAFSQANAFSLSPTSADAALIVTLPPGSYTLELGGLNGSTGVALAEVYEVP